MSITASQLYNYIQCPRRVWRGIYGPQNEKQDEENTFLQLIWERGIFHEKEIIESIGAYKDISSGTLGERIAETKSAMDEEVDLIYQGVVKLDDMVGIPDLLKGDGKEYIPIEEMEGQVFAFDKMIF